MTSSLRTTNQIALSDETGATVLGCPRCGGAHLHHTMVTHHLRETEDGLSSASFLPGQHVKPLGGNPSARRGGVVISFECERCGPDLELTIAQHKGETELAWRFVDSAGTE